MNYSGFRFICSLALLASLLPVSQVSCVKQVGDDLAQQSVPDSVGAVVNELFPETEGKILEAKQETEDDRSEDQDQQNASSLSKENTSTSIESIGEPDSLDELRESYMRARKESSNVWLDFSNKSCYIYLYSGGGQPSESIAAFDLDGTIIKPKDNKKFCTSATDWDLFSDQTKSTVQQYLLSNEARLVIFTNQNGVGLNKVPLRVVQERIELVTERLGVPCIVFMAVQRDAFRKPETGMFKLFNESFNDGLPINYESSFYCGDAVGYPSFSDSDIKFASKLGLPFLAPEEFLQGVKPKLVPTSSGKTE